ncbi:hypothetical protein [Streptomyces sp. NPDC049906]|uniref:hypothetical protein n=1 Tax=Streptomyces sp. NPDC049906 TaxID=3155656 RepID=UPI0034448CB7
MIGRRARPARARTGVRGQPAPVPVPTAPEDRPWPVYRALVLAEGPVAGTGGRGRVVLGTFSSPHPGRVLRWLRRQAVRVANGLDPDPVTAPHLVVRALRPDPAPCAGYPDDVPTALRDWAHRDGCRNEARRQLTSGEPFLLVSGDHTGWYALTAWPVADPGRVPPGHFRPVPGFSPSSGSRSAAS